MTVWIRAQARPRFRLAVLPVSACDLFEERLERLIDSDGRLVKLKKMVTWDIIFIQQCYSIPLNPTSL
jgi:hypothetical protein